MPRRPSLVYGHMHGSETMRQQLMSSSMWCGASTRRKPTGLRPTARRKRQLHRRPRSSAPTSSRRSSANRRSCALTPTSALRSWPEVWKLHSRRCRRLKLRRRHGTMRRGRRTPRCTQRWRMQTSRCRPHSTTFNIPGYSGDGFGRHCTADVPRKLISYSLSYDRGPTFTKLGVHTVKFHGWLQSGPCSDGRCRLCVMRSGHCWRSVRIWSTI